MYWGCQVLAGTTAELPNLPHISLFGSSAPAQPSCLTSSQCSTECEPPLLFCQLRAVSKADISHWGPKAVTWCENQSGKVVQGVQEPRAGGVPGVDLPMHPNPPPAAPGTYQLEYS